MLYLASAGDMGGIMGKKFGFGISLALPVIRQNDDIFRNRSAQLHMNRDPRAQQTSIIKITSISVLYSGLYMYVCFTKFYL